MWLHGFDLTEGRGTGRVQDPSQLFPESNYNWLSATRSTFVITAAPVWGCMKGDLQELIHKNNFPAVLNLVMGASDLVGPLATDCVRGTFHGVHAGVSDSCTSISFYSNLACVSIKRMITMCMIFCQMHTDCAFEAVCTALPLCHT